MVEYRQKVSIHITELETGYRRDFIQRLIVGNDNLTSLATSEVVCITDTYILSHY